MIILNAGNYMLETRKIDTGLMKYKTVIKFPI